MNTHAVAVAQPKKMLQNLANWLDEAAAYVEDKNASTDDWLQARLAIDMFALVRQVQSACDTAKFIAARLAGVEAPKNEDNEKTFDEIKKRIADTVAFLDTMEPAQFEGVEDKRLDLPFLPDGKWARAEDYVVEFALPNLYFHLTMAYAILRHNGVALGKRPFLGSLPIQG